MSMSSFLRLFLKKYSILAFILGAFVASQPITAAALLNLELTQGVDSRIPIAIYPFEGQSGSPASMSEIIKTDLSNSGYFRILESSKNGIDYPSWKNQGIDNVVVGSMAAQGGGQYGVGFQLLDVVAKHRLLAEKYKAPSQLLRHLAHHISDEVYEKLTGVRGVFSTKIAYVLVKRVDGKPRYILEVADADGYAPKPLLISSQPIMSPRWSPDGRKLAYVSFENRRAQIYIAELATGNRTLVSSFPGINGAPAWSPDGRKLALVLSKTGKPKIYVIDLGTKALKQITSGLSIDTEPSWSPDGKSLLFTSDRSGKPQIYEANLSDGSIQRITFKGNYNARASYTPDKKYIVMLHREDRQFSIAMMDRKTEHVRLLSHANLDESPSVAPNGKMVLFATVHGNRGVLGVVSADGRVQLRLPSREGDVREPAWSPFLN